MLVLLEHYFGRLDYDRYRISLPEAELLSAPSGDDALDHVSPNTNHHMRHNFSEMNLGDFSNKLVPSGKRHLFRIPHLAYDSGTV